MTEKNEKTQIDTTETQEKVLGFLKTNSPSGMGNITTSLNDIDENLVKAAVIALLTKGDIEKTGQKRGTKYATKGFDWSSPEATVDAPKFRDQIVTALRKLGTNTTLRQISEELKTDPNQLRSSLDSLKIDGTVIQNGFKRGAKYSLSDMTSDDGDSDTKTETSDDVQASSEPRDFDSIDEFCNVAVQFIDSKKEFDFKEISKALVDALPGSTVNGESVSEYETSKFVKNLVSNSRLTTRTVNEKLAYVRG